MILNKFKLLLFSLVSFCTLSCNKLEYNLNEINRHENDITITTQYNIDQLIRKEKKDTIHLVLFGDTQRHYDDFEDLIKAVNKLPNIDAIIVTGDIADFGLAWEYDLINEQFKKLNVPFLTVIGNHDLVANGPTLYQKFYGPLDYSFTWNDIRFIAHNTNGREYNFNGKVPDLNWMQNQLKDTNNYQSCIFISHVPPNNVDFDASLEADYTELIRSSKNTIFSTNGHRHIHGLSKPYNDGIWYLNTSSPDNRFYSYVTIYPYATTSKKFDCSFIAF